MTKVLGKIGFLLIGLLFLACGAMPEPYLAAPVPPAPPEEPLALVQDIPVPEAVPEQAAPVPAAPVPTPAPAPAPVPEPVIQLAQIVVEPSEQSGYGPAGGLVFYPVLRTSSLPPATDQVYRVGDTGPAGGIIFYVNPGADAGWTYLEAAPDSTEATASWSISQRIPTNPIKDSRGIGMGKPNSDYIMEEAWKLGGGWGWAAQLCDELEVNGFDDWFLPSRDELNIMWGALHRRGRGGFKDEWYWSSTPSNDAGSRIWMINFADGSQREGIPDVWNSDNWSQQYRLRAIRQF
jgi:hypothetical protein